MVQVSKDGKVERIDKPMPKVYWMRHKKPTVNLARGCPFAVDRQLEDQKFQIEFNRNPQLHTATKVDKVRSETIAATKGESRAVAVKANAINKIVREASGVHNYTIVPPPKRASEKNSVKREKLDPETNPRMRPYLAEAKSKPTLCSFGHRPRSASRTFHPATMKFRLKHGEVAAPAGVGSKCGLSVSVLNKILHAPRIPKFGEQFDLESEKPGHDVLDTTEEEVVVQGTQGDFGDLFFSEEEKKRVFSKELAGKGLSRSDSSLSSKQGTNSLSSMGVSSAKLNPNTKLDPIKGRPVWDEAFHMIKLPSNHVFSLRASNLVEPAMPLGERLNRFRALAVSHNQVVPFCTEKQETDRSIASGVPAEDLQLTAPLKGRPKYFDPWDVEVKIVKHYRRQLEKEQEEKQKANKYQLDLHSIPQVEYFPTTYLRKTREKSSKMRSKPNSATPLSPLNERSLETGHSLTFSESPSKVSPSHTTGPTVESGSPGRKTHGSSSSLSHHNSMRLVKEQRRFSERTSELPPDWEATEAKYYAALKKARRGDRNALVNVTLKKHLERVEQQEGSVDQEGLAAGQEVEWRDVYPSNSGSFEYTHNPDQDHIDLSKTQGEGEFDYVLEHRG